MKFPKDADRFTIFKNNNGVFPPIGYLPLEELVMELVTTTVYAGEDITKLTDNTSTSI